MDSMHRCWNRRLALASRGRWRLACVAGLAVVACLALAACAPAPPPAPVAERLPLADCQLGSPGLSRRLAARCGSLTVPENHRDPQGRRIELKVAVLPAVRRDAAPDPLVLLAGGPGQAATEAFVPLLPLLEGVREDRDLVLVDQRGTGGSSPLRCEAPGELGELVMPTTAELERWLDRCLAELEADPRFYTTEAAVADLEAVRLALGVETFNLYGVSYGSRLAQSYAARHPQRVRTLALDGVVPQDLALGEEFAEAAQRAFDLQVARCQADPACARVFPDLPGALRALLAELAAEPRKVELGHPTTGLPTTIELGRDQLAGLVHAYSYSPEASSLLPLLLSEAHTTGDLRRLAAQGIQAGKAFGGIEEGLNFSVRCAEDAPFIDAGRADALAAASYLGDLQLRMTRTICARWPRGEIPADAKTPLASEVPTLLLSGELDPVTPPAYGERVAAGLPNSLHLVAPGMGHNVLPRGCVPKVVARFIAAGSVAGLEVDCVAELAPPPFFLNPSGPVEATP